MSIAQVGGVSFACEKFHKVLDSAPEMSPEPPGFSPDQDPAADAAREARSGWKYAGIGLQFAGSILLFLYVGQWVDRRLGSGPVGLILGVFLGAGAAFLSMYRRLMADLARDERRRRARGQG